MKDAKSTAIPNTHKAVASNNSVTMIDLNEPRGQELTEDVNWFEDLQHEGRVFPLPDTPVKPPTKNTKRNDGENEEILESVCVLSEKHDETFHTVSAIKKTVESTSQQLEKLTSTVQWLTLGVNQQKQNLNSMKNMVHKLQAENKSLKAEITDCQSYSRR